MKRVKLMSVALVALSMVAVTSVNAQPQQREPKSVEEIAKMKTERMTKSLELTEDQSGKIYDITLKYAEERQAKAEEMKAKREEAKESKDGEKKECPKQGEQCGQEGRRPMPPHAQQPQRRGQEKMGAEQKAMMKEIVEVLTTDQIVEFIEMQSKMGDRKPQGQRPGMQRGGERRPQGGRPEGGRPQQPRGDRPQQPKCCADAE